MPLKSSLTGSYPPVNSPDVSIHSIGSSEEQEQTVRQGIRRAIEDQIEAGIDILVDGQVRCGLRPVPHEAAKAKIAILAKAARTV